MENVTILFEQNVLGLQITVDQSRLAQQAETVQKLLSKDSHESGAKTSELILLDQLVQIDREELKHQTQMLPVDERVLESHDVMIVVLVHTAVKLATCQYFSASQWFLWLCSPSPIRKPPSCSG